MSTNELDKIKLVYEFNNASPLFARVAESYMIDDHYDEAISILKSGLQRYPDYLTAKIVLIETLAKKAEYEEAANMLDELRSELDDKSINYYLEKIEQERSIKEKLMDSINDGFSNIEDDLENLADKISKAKIPPPNDKNKNAGQVHSTPKGTQFVSETLAEIYLTQGNYKEALEIYEKLLESNPKKSEEFKQKIEEIKKSLK